MTGLWPLYIVWLVGLLLLRKLFKLSWGIAALSAYIITAGLFWLWAAKIAAEGGTQNGLIDIVLWPYIAVRGKTLEAS